MSFLLSPDMLIFWLDPELKLMFDAIVTGLGAEKEPKKIYKIHFAPLILDPTFNAGPCFLTEIVAVNPYTQPATLISCGFFLHCKQNMNTYYRMAVELSMAFPNWCKPPSEGGLIACILDEERALNVAMKKVFPHAFFGNCWNHVRGSMERQLSTLGLAEKYLSKETNLVETFFKALDLGKEHYLKLLESPDVPATFLAYWNKQKHEMALSTMTREAREAHGFVDSNGNVIRPTTNAAESAHRMIKRNLKDDTGEEWNEIYVLVPQIDRELSYLATQLILVFHGKHKDYKLSPWPIKILDLLAKKVQITPPNQLNELDFSVWMDIQRCRTEHDPHELKTAYHYLERLWGVEPTLPAIKVYPRFYFIFVDHDWKVEQIVDRLVFYRWNRRDAVEFAVEVLARSREVNAVVAIAGGFLVKSYVTNGYYIVNISNGNEPVCQNPGCVRRNARKARLCFHIMLVFISNRYDLDLLLECLGSPKGFSQRNITAWIRLLIQGGKSTASQGRKRSQRIGTKSNKSPLKATKDEIIAAMSEENVRMDPPSPPVESTGSIESSEQEGSQDESSSASSSEKDAPPSPRVFKYSKDSNDRVVMWMWTVYKIYRKTPEVCVICNEEMEGLVCKGRGLDSEGAKISESVCSPKCLSEHPNQNFPILDEQSPASEAFQSEYSTLIDSKK
jgi:hypothetical protein